MLFSSITFLFYFLPVLLIVYFIVPKKYKNLVLFIFSLFFYFYGEPKYVFLLLLSCIINYIMGYLIGKHRKYAKVFLIIALIYNIGSSTSRRLKDYILEIKKRIKRINAFISNPLNYENLNNPFFSTRSRTYVWIEENKEN